MFGGVRNTILEPPEPLPCAAQNGTTFIVDDLFYNNEQRRKVLLNIVSQCFSSNIKQLYTHPFALKQTLGSGAEEYARILDLVARYAISRPDVGFSCKKQVNNSSHAFVYCRL